MSQLSFPPLVSPGVALSAAEVRRYSRHLLLPDVAMLGQRRLKNSRVLVVGAGGLGSPALLYLAAAGVGTLGIADFDSVDESNLQRQIIHGQRDVGRSKAASARDSVQELNPLVEVVLHEARLDCDNVMDILAGYDLVVDGTDNFATRYLLNDAAYFAQMPYVWASIYRFDGQISVFAPTWSTSERQLPCYRCVFPEPPPPGSVPSCAEGGVLGVLCASVGSVQVTEAIKLLTGVGRPLVGQLMIYDALAMSYTKLPIGKNPECALCGEHPTITSLIDYDEFCRAGARSESGCAQDAEDAEDEEDGVRAAAAAISVARLAELLGEREAGARDFVLVDVREAVEREINQIPGAVSIPTAEFRSGQAFSRLPDRNSKTQVILHCKSGARSLECLTLLQQAGYVDVLHVAGGVAAWVDQIDDTQPTY